MKKINNIYVLLVSIVILASTKVNAQISKAMQKLESAETHPLFNASKIQLRMRMQSLEIVVLKPAALHMRIKEQATEQVKSCSEVEPFVSSPKRRTVVIALKNALSLS